MIADSLQLTFTLYSIYSLTCLLTCRYKSNLTHTNTQLESDFCHCEYALPCKTLLFIVFHSTNGIKLCFVSSLLMSLTNDKLFSIVQTTPRP